MVEYHSLQDRQLMFLSDLRRASDDAQRLARLYPHDEYYLPHNYFTSAERTHLLDTLYITVIDVNKDGHQKKQTLREALADVLAKKTERAGKQHICTSHDLLPVFQQAFRPRPKFDMDRKFGAKLKDFWKRNVHLESTFIVA
jgi:hypothetical protein